VRKIEDDAKFARGPPGHSHLLDRTGGRRRRASALPQPGSRYIEYDSIRVAQNRQTVLRAARQIEDNSSIVGSRPEPDGADVDPTRGFGMRRDGMRARGMRRTRQCNHEQCQRARKTRSGKHGAIS
jgi:hypothetical protein